VALAEWLWLWKKCAARQREWKPGSDSGAQRRYTRPKQCGEEKFRVEAWARTSSYFKCIRGGA
jgi:hypothetical protein